VLLSEAVTVRATSFDERYGDRSAEGDQQPEGTARRQGCRRMQQQQHGNREFRDRKEHAEWMSQPVGHAKTTKRIP
jgi:hypothetical protein